MSQENVETVRRCYESEFWSYRDFSVPRSSPIPTSSSICRGMPSAQTSIVATTASDAWSKRWTRCGTTFKSSPRNSTAAVSFGGAIVFASAAAIGATLHFTLVDTADNIDPIAVQALNAIDYEFYIPFVVGVGVFILASGISVVRHGALPKWLGWIAILIGIVAFTPIGFFALLAAILWVLVVCIIGLVRARGDGAPAPGVPGV
jgi:hypothetical protein